MTRSQRKGISGKWNARDLLLVLPRIEDDLHIRLSASQKPVNSPKQCFAGLTGTCIARLEHARRGMRRRRRCAVAEHDDLRWFAAMRHPVCRREWITRRVQEPLRIDREGSIRAFPPSLKHRTSDDAVRHILSAGGWMRYWNGARPAVAPSLGRLVKAGELRRSPSNSRRMRSMMPALNSRHALGSRVPRQRQAGAGENHDPSGLREHALHERVGVTELKVGRHRGEYRPLAHTRGGGIQPGVQVPGCPTHGATRDVSLDGEPRASSVPRSA